MGQPDESERKELLQIVSGEADDYRNKMGGVNGLGRLPLLTLL